ncbi:MAG: methyltransferase domain-containing protein [Candidatus Hydrogenedens sp.]|nr:methyltransferase domain-containing protein [Candidatus Hydrogenedens sp.]
MPQASNHPFLIEYPYREVVGAYRAGAIRLYCHIRAHILRNRILREVGQYIPFAGRVTELGCGFGLFANCLAKSRSDCVFKGCDLNAGRIQEASNVSKTLGIDNIEFHAGDAVAYVESMEEQDCIYMLDLVHHLPPDQVDRFINTSWKHLKPGGLLVIKDVSNKPYFKMAFTWILDVLMTRGEIPYYRSPEAFIELLSPLGGRIVVHYLDDYLPYPHVMYVVHKPL